MGNIFDVLCTYMEHTNQDNVEGVNIYFHYNPVNCLVKTMGLRYCILVRHGQ